MDELTSAAQASKVTVYVAYVEVTDTTPGNVGGVSATRFVTLGDVTVATVTSGGTPPVWALLLGDSWSSGQVSDADTSLVYLNARYYDPVLARLISLDPRMNPGDPKTLCPYRYAEDNPVVFTDATGLEPRVSSDGTVTGVPGVYKAEKNGKITNAAPNRNPANSSSVPERKRTGKRAFEVGTATLKN